MSLALLLNQNLRSSVPASGSLAKALVASTVLATNASITINLLAGAPSASGGTQYALENLPGFSFSNATGGYSLDGSQYFGPNQIKGSTTFLQTGGYGGGLTYAANASYTDPFGGTSAYEFTWPSTTSGAPYFLGDTLGVLPSTTYTLSIYARSVSGSNVFRLFGFDTTGSVVYGGTVDAVTTTSWQRYSITFTTNSSVGALYGAITNGNTGGAAADILFAGFQLERGTSVTPYKPTSGSLSSASPRIIPARLVEAGSTNLTPYSAMTSGTGWSFYNASAGANTTAPDGSSNALLVNYTGTNGAIYQPGVTLSVGTVYTMSCWVKAVSGSPNFYLVANPGASTTTTAATSSWVRYTSTFTAIANANIGVNGDPASTGVLAVWGFQLEAQLVASSYIPTTTGPVTRPDNFTSSGMLVEGAATNLFTYSADYTNAAWAKSNATITAASIIAPDGTQTGQTITNASSTMGTCAVYQTPTKTAGTTYTSSWFVKPGNTTRVFMGQQTDTGSFNDSIFDFSTGSWVVLGSGIVAYSAKALPGGWWRMSVSFTAATTGSYQASIGPCDSTATSAASSTAGAFCYLWGGQIETGSVATSYIPTTSATASRAADVVSQSYSNTLNNLIVRSPTLGDMRYPAAGVTNYQPASTNVLSWSGYLGATAVASTIAAPDGTLTAANISLPSGAGFGGVGPAWFYAGSTTISASTQVTLSAWMRADVGSAVVQLDYQGASDWTGPDITLDTTWRRYSWTFAGDAGAAGYAFAFALGGSAATGATFHVWGPQIEIGAAVNAYVPNSGTGTAKASVTSVAPFSLGPGGGTNLQPYTDFSTGWYGVNPVPVVTGSVTAPDGTTTAATITNDTASSAHGTSSGSGVAHGSGVAQTYSIYLKAGTCRYAWVFDFDTGYASAFDLLLGTVTSSNSSLAGASTQIIPVGNGWYRVVLTALTQSAGTSYFTFGISNTGTPTWSGGQPTAYTGAGETLYAWGPQVELASAASGYIPNPSSGTATAPKSPWANSTISAVELFTSSSGITATLTKTLVAATAASTGAVGVAGTMASTLAAATLSSAGIGSAAGTLASTLLASTVSSNGNLITAGTLASTLLAATVASAALGSAAGTLAKTTLAATVASNGAVGIAGTGAVTLAASTLSSTGNLIVSGSLASTLLAGTVVSQALGSVAGTLASTLLASTVASAGTVSSGTATGTLASTLLAATVASAGLGSAAGSLSSTLLAATVASQALGAGIGSLAVTLLASTMASNGAVGVAGQLASTLAASTVSSNATLAPFTGTVAVTLLAATVASQALGAGTGTLAKTLLAATVSGVGSNFSGVAGALASTLAASTVASNGNTGLVGSTAVTLLAASLAANMALGVVGSLSSTLGASTLASAALGSGAGTLSSTLLASTLASSGLLIVSGTASATLNASTVASQAYGTGTGTLASTLLPATMASAGIGSVAGTLSSTLLAATLASNAILITTGTSILPLAAATVSGTGLNGSTTATASMTLAASTLSAAGTLGTSVAGTLSVVLLAASVAAQALGSAAGTLASTLTASPLAATGSLGLVGSTNITLAASTVAASGSPTPLSATVAATLQSASMAAAAIGSAIGSGAATLQAASVVSTGQLIVSAVVSATLGAATLSSAGTAGALGTAALPLQAATLSAAGIGSVAGTLASALVAATLSATGVGPITGAVAVTLKASALAAGTNTGTVGSVLSILTAATLAAQSGILRSVYGPMVAGVSVDAMSATVSVDYLKATATADLITATPTY